jgi:hypothetical protein
MKKLTKKLATARRALSAEETKRRAELDAFHRRQQKRFEAGARLLRIRCKKLPSGTVLDPQLFDKYIEEACGIAAIRWRSDERDTEAEARNYREYFTKHNVPLAISLTSQTFKSRPFYGVLHPSMYHWYAMQPASVETTQWRLMFTKK